MFVVSQSSNNVAAVEIIIWKIFLIKSGYHNEHHIEIWLQYGYMMLVKKLLVWTFRR
jgi:hypothetical protein